MPRPVSLVAFALAVLLAGSPALAAETDSSSETNYDVAGRTPVICTLTTDEGETRALVNFSTVDRNIFQIDQMVSQASLSTQAASFDLTLAGVCNSAHVIRLESLNNGLWQVSEPSVARPEGFGTAIPYEVVTRWSDQQADLAADAGVRQAHRISVPISSPASGLLKLHFEIRQGATNLRANAPIIAGAYSDTLTVILEPQQ